MLKILQVLACLAIALATPALALKHGTFGGGGAGAVETPGPSQTLFNTPYYTCVRNFYVATNGFDSRTTTQAQVSTTPWLTIGKYNSAIGSSVAGDCINVAPGSYALGATVTKGGSTASSSGYVVYRCQIMNTCIITDPSNQTNNSAFFVGANYVMVDGFVFTGGNGTNNNTTGVISCQDINCGGGNARTNSPLHHIWVLNNIISGYGEHGISLSNGEYMYSIHNMIFNNAHDCFQPAQGSGISYYLPIAVSGYTPTADDANNPVTGNTGTLFRQFLMWNVLYNNFICTGVAGFNVTDGNGIILDDWQGDQFGSNKATYTGGGLVAFNISYNNGATGIHAFNSAYVSFINNSIYNNALDSNLTSWYYNLGDNGSYGTQFINNVVRALCASSPPSGNALTAISAYGLGNSISTPTTTLSGGINASVTSLTVASAASFPGGATFNTLFGGTLRWNNSNALPGGNLIQIDSEIMWVQAGWTTTTWTVLRGYNGTTAATHSNGATVSWIQSYATNNVTSISATLTRCQEIDTASGAFYSSTANKQNTLPSWLDAGNTSTGSRSTPPIGSNFALSGASATIAYGTTASPFNFLPASAADAGACYHTLTVCPGGVVTDDFNRANGGLGTNWVASPSFPGLAITSNTVGSATSAWTISYRNPATNTFANDQTSRVALVSGASPAVMVRHQSGISSGYFCLTTAIGAGAQLGIYRIDNGTFNLLVNSATITTAPNDILSITVTGSTITAALNGVTQATFTDTTYTSGSPGIGAFNGVFDNWIGGPIQ